MRQQSHKNNNFL